MIVAVTVKSCNRFSSIVLPVIVDESEALALLGDLVLRQVDAGDVTKRLEQFLQVGLLGAFRQVGNSNCGCVFI